jgi:hypothetical protein
MHNNQAAILKVLQNREICDENGTLEKKLPEFLIINAKKKEISNMTWKLNIILRIMTIWRGDENVLQKKDESRFEE